MSLLVWAPEASRGEEDAQHTNLRVAGWHTQRLGAEGHAVLAATGPEGTREALEAHMERAEGLVLLAHGDAAGVYDTHGALAFGHLHCARLAGRWVHVLACEVAQELPALAASHGCPAFAAYTVPLILEWDPDTLPTELLPRVRELFTEVSARMARGTFDKPTLTQAVKELSDSIITWCDEHPGEAPGLEISAQQLLSRLVVYPGASTHAP